MVMHNITRQLSLLMLLVSALAVCAQEPAVQAPATVSAGSALAVSTKGQGKGTLYLLGPSHAVKKVVNLGEDVSFSGEDVTASGLYQVVACGSSGCATKVVEVTPGPASSFEFPAAPFPRSGFSSKCSERNRIGIRSLSQYGAHADSSQL